MLLYNGALVILKQVISLNVCAVSTVLIYMIISYLVVCVISFDYCTVSVVIYAVRAAVAAASTTTPLR